MSEVKSRPIVYLRDVSKLPKATYKMEHRFNAVIPGRMFPDLDVYISYDRDSETTYYITKCPDEFFDTSRHVRFDEVSFPAVPGVNADLPNWTELCVRDPSMPGAWAPPSTRDFGCGPMGMTPCSSAGISGGNTFFPSAWSPTPSCRSL